MAAQTLAGVDFQSSDFKDLFYGYYTHRLNLYNSLLIEAPDELISPDSKGYTYSVPYIEPGSGDSDVITTSLTTTINNLSNWKDIGAWCEREKAWGAEQIIKIVAGYDITEAIAKFMAEYWASEVHKSTVSLLTGIFTTALASTHVYSGDSGVTINAPGVAKAKQTIFGDNADLVTSAVMNSKVITDAIIVGLATATPMQDETFRSGRMATMLGMDLYQTDKLTAVSNVYPNYFGAPGALIYKFRNREQQSFNNANVYKVGAVEIELSRDSVTNGGQDRLISRASYTVHCPGVQFDGTVTSNPTNTELATGTTWTKTAADDKYIKLMKYESL